MKLYDRNVTARHLDIGVGTGHYLDTHAGRFRTRSSPCSTSTRIPSPPPRAGSRDSRRGRYGRIASRRSRSRRNSTPSAFATCSIAFPGRFPRRRSSSTISARFWLPGHESSGRRSCKATSRVRDPRRRSWISTTEWEYPRMRAIGWTISRPSCGSVSPMCASRREARLRFSKPE
jgi:hypothetical protein